MKYLSFPKKKITLLLCRFFFRSRSVHKCYLGVVHSTAIVLFIKSTNSTPTVVVVLNTQHTH